MGIGSKLAVQRGQPAAFISLLPHHAQEEICAAMDALHLPSNVAGDLDPASIYNETS